MSEEFTAHYVALGLLVGDAKCCVAVLEDREPPALQRRVVVCRDSNHVPRSMGGDGGPDARCTCK